MALVVELLRLALIDDHSSPRPKEAKNYKTQQVSLSAGVPRSYILLYYYPGRTGVRPGHEKIR